MSKRKPLWLLAIGLLTAVLCFCTKSNPMMQVIKLTEESSYFNDFTVKNNKVYMNCALVIENISTKGVTVRIKASSPQDVSGGLLKSAGLHGFSKDLATDTFTLSTGENQITVIFIGEYGGTNIKQNRLLPENISFDLIK